MSGIQALVLGRYLIFGQHVSIDRLARQNQNDEAAILDLAGNTFHLPETHGKAGKVAPATEGDLREILRSRFLRKPCPALLVALLCGS